MFKYQYWLREYLFRILKRLPSFLQRPLVHFWLLHQKKYLESLKTPAQITLYVTNRCNARCEHCFYWQEVAAGEKKELSLTSLEKIAKSLNNPLNTLSLTGGEPFLRDDLEKVVEVFWANNRIRKVNLVTNGSFPEKTVDFAKEVLKQTNIDLNIQVSLDGLRATHDQIRKIPVFDKALETVRLLGVLAKKHRNFQVTIQTTITSQNLDEIEKLGDFIKKKFPEVHHGFQFVRSANFDVFNLDREFLTDYNPNSKKPLIAINQMEKALKIIKKFSNKKHSLLNSYVLTMNQEIIKLKRKKKPFVKCLAGKYDGVIWSDGQVSLCEFTKPFAGLKDYDFNFGWLWNSPKAQAAREKICCCFCAHTCNLLNAMQFDKRALLEVLRI